MAARRHVRALAEAIFATHHGPPPPNRIEWVCADFEDFVEQAGPRPELIFDGALLLATWVAPTTIGQRPPLARLSLEDRARALDTLERTPAGLPILALKAILSTIYYEHRDAQEEIGVQLDCLEDAR